MKGLTPFLFLFFSLTVILYLFIISPHTHVTNLRQTSYIHTYILFTQSYIISYFSRLYIYTPFDNGIIALRI